MEWILSLCLIGYGTTFAKRRRNFTCFKTKKFGSRGSDPFLHLRALRHADCKTNQLFGLLELSKASFNAERRYMFSRSALRKSKSRQGQNHFCRFFLLWHLYIPKTSSGDCTRYPRDI